MKRRIWFSFLGALLFVSLAFLVRSVFVWPPNQSVVARDIETAGEPNRNVFAASVQDLGEVGLSRPAETTLLLAQTAFKFDEQGIAFGSLSALGQDAETADVVCRVIKSRINQAESAGVEIPLEEIEAWQRLAKSMDAPVDRAMCLTDLANLRAACVSQEPPTRRELLEEASRQLAIGSPAVVVPIISKYLFYPVIACVGFVFTQICTTLLVESAKIWAKELHGVPSKTETESNRQKKDE